ncbi:hypothetical protein K2173_015984 [Erythroxylum novogranatense]|uniref:Nas2 N-terminal domain-containing protein n=1 Tax=Erythroxylum novogranatense TaxID=1862640 RepID=A0AAV8SFH4_9ROSI|nr:hypothetical protein K2173_015984 [Erythroxylum novogranatense]
MKLMEKRNSMEVEMNFIFDPLCAPDGSGLSRNLLDSEGFPRPDIDIPVVRAKRHCLVELHNDHKEIMEKIYGKIQILHLTRLVGRSSSFKDSGDHRSSDKQNSSMDGTNGSASSLNVTLRDSPGFMDIYALTSLPFAVVNEIADSSQQHKMVYSLEIKL